MQTALLAIAVAANLLVILFIWFWRKSPAPMMEEWMRGLNRVEGAMREELGRGREEAQRLGEGQRRELGETLMRYSETMQTSLGQVSATVDAKLQHIQLDNEKRLEQIREMVQEKLQSTLEQRLGEQFGQVRDTLHQVHAGLGEMKALAAGVGDLKKVLSNVKTRGLLGEVQLGNLLEQMLTPEQFAVNIITKRHSQDRVEFAIRLPGREKNSDGADQPVWLPIDAKFPQEDYVRLLDATERGDLTAAESAQKQLESRLRNEARNIQSKYLDPPHTTDFAIMFLPTEGLFAEALRRPGLTEELQRQYRIVIAGPTTLAALLTSLQMGFRTLAIEKRSSEVWQLLGSVKTEFDEFGSALDKVQKKLQEASNTVKRAAVRKRAVEKKLRGVETLPLLEESPLTENAVSSEQ